jgi:hypothetical protein
VDVPATKTRGRRGATWNEDQLVLVTRHGRREDVWWTYSFGPIDFEGNVGGVPRRDAKFVVSALTPTRRSRHADADVVGHDETLAGRLFVRRLAQRGRTGAPFHHQMRKAKAPCVREPGLALVRCVVWS